MPATFGITKPKNGMKRIRIVVWFSSRVIPLLSILEIYRKEGFLPNTTVGFGRNDLGYSQSRSGFAGAFVNTSFAAL
jgi:hypothetical protein